jgi:hypothetical protein
MTAAEQRIDLPLLQLRDADFSESQPWLLL